MSTPDKLREALKPCPFCGLSDLKIKTGLIGGESSVQAVFCEHCGGSGSFAELQEHAIESWNRRATPGTQESALAKRVCEECGKSTGRDGSYGCCTNGCFALVYLCLDCFYGKHADGNVLCKAHKPALPPSTAQAPGWISMKERLLDDAMGLLHNHEQDHDPGWLKDYEDVCARYDALPLPPAPTGDAEDRRIPERSES